MQQKHQVSYSFRVEAQLMKRATLVASARDEKMSHVIRRAIRAYVDIYGKKGLANK